MRVEEIFKLREADEPRFWSEIANLFQKECSSPEFVAQVGPRLLDAGVKFTQMRQEFKQFPYHVGCALDVKEDSPFLFFVHFFANNKEEYERPVPLVLGVLPLPGDTYYVLHLHSDEEGTKNVVEVFAPHVFQRYATRSYRLASDDEALPDGWSVPQRFVWKKNPKAGGSSEAFFDEEAYKQLFVLTGKFFGRSKLSRLCENKDALSLEAQKTGSSDTLSCLWLDGMTYCVPMGQGLFHKTFIPYWPDASASDDASISNEQLEAWLDKSVRLMKKYNAYIFCSEEQIADYYLWSQKRGYKFSVLVWEKPVSIISKQRFCQNAEFIVRIYDKGTALNKFDDSSMYSRVFHSKPLSDKLHPTQKPLDLVKKLILLSTNEGDAVLDPFMGSATTCVAAIQLGRKYVGMDNNEKFFSIAEDRIRKVSENLFNA